MQKLVDLFSQEPASLTWSQSADGQRQIGTSEGFVLTIGETVEAVGLFPPDAPELAARNGVLMQLLLAATRPDWQSSADWLAQQMRLAQRPGRAAYEGPNYSRRVWFVWDMWHSRAILRIS